MSNQVNSGINFSDYAIKLSSGSHKSASHGLCIMECVAYISGEAHTDHPKCADEFATSYAIYLNDQTIPSHRDQLIKYVLRLAGSKNDEFINQRLYTLINIAVKEYFPERLKDLPARSVILSLQSLPEVTDSQTLKFVMNALRNLMCRVSHAAQISAKQENSEAASKLRAAADYMGSLTIAVDILISPAFPKNQNTFNNIARIVFAILTPESRVMSDEHFEMHCATLEKLLTFTDPKEPEGTETKLKELVTISNKEVAVAV